MGTLERPDVQGKAEDAMVRGGFSMVQAFLGRGRTPGISVSLTRVTFIVVITIWDAILCLEYTRNATMAAICIMNVQKTLLYITRSGPLLPFVPFQCVIVRAFVIGPDRRWRRMRTGHHISLMTRWNRHTLQWDVLQKHQVIMPLDGHGLNANSQVISNPNDCTPSLHDI